MVQNDKKFCLNLYLRNCTSCDCGFWYTCVNVCEMMMPEAISSFQNSVFFLFWFLGGGAGVKDQKMTHNYQFQYVALYISRTVVHINLIFGTHVWNNDISRCCFSLFFNKEYNIVNIKILAFFIGPLQQFF